MPPRPLCPCWRTVVALLWVLAALSGGSALAQGIAFTVQVIAVSDQNNAIDISRTLVRDGYPAYVVRSTGAEGDVYRVRVGAFANRAAAARYAAAMPPIGGAEPVPMVAEAIPAGIMPLAPRVLWQGGWSGGELAVLPWPAGIALRQQASTEEEATYTLIQGAEVRTLRAWWVMPLAALPDGAPPAEAEGGFGDIPFIDLRTPASAVSDAERGSAPTWMALESDTPEVGLAILRDRPLWPAEGGDREAFEAAVIAFVAGRLGIDPARVEEEVREASEGEAPRLALVELSDRSGRDTGDVRALASGDGVLDRFGPALAAGSDLRWWPALPVLEPLLPSAGAAGSFEGDGWSIAADFGFARLTTPEGASWRAVAGTPVWSDGRFVMVLDGADLVLVDFAPR